MISPFNRFAHIMPNPTRCLSFKHTHTRKQYNHCTCLTATQLYDNVFLFWISFFFLFWFSMLKAAGKRTRYLDIVSFSEAPIPVSLFTSSLFLVTHFTQLKNNFTLPKSLFIWKNWATLHDDEEVKKRKKETKNKFRLKLEFLFNLIFPWFAFASSFTFHLCCCFISVIFDCFLTVHCLLCCENSPISQYMFLFTVTWYFFSELE